MNITVEAGSRTGIVSVPSSKSEAHRLLILAALGEHEVNVGIKGVSKDIEATALSLAALGAKIERSMLGNDECEYKVSPIERKKPRRDAEAEAILPCGESGSTLRFLLPIVCALGKRCCFVMEGKLPERPLEPLDSELERMGASIKKEGSRLYVDGRISPGAYRLPGNVSSQYISGLLMALPLLAGESTLSVSGPIESKGYISMTEGALKNAGIRIEAAENDEGRVYCIPGNQAAKLPARISAEGDFSGAAFFLCMGAFSEGGITVRGLNSASLQGDKAVVDILKHFGADVTFSDDKITVKKGNLKGCEIDAAQIPDLIPVLSVVAAGADGETRIINAGRLRIKESDRLASTSRMIKTLGGDIEEKPDSLYIKGKTRLSGGEIVDPANDHRIAMSAATMAAFCEKNVEISDKDCVQKSYPGFWNDLDALKKENLK